MANSNAAIGFIPIRHQKGGEIRLGQYTIASAYGTAIGRGDVVELLGSGKTIGRAAAGNVDNLGVFMGCHYVDSNGNMVWSEYWPASTTTKNSIDAVALVIDDPHVVFRVQTTTLAAADVGNLMDITSGTPSSTTRLSGVALDGATKATTGCSFRVLGLSNIPDNEYGAYAKVDCVFAEHILLTGAAGAGGI